MIATKAANQKTNLKRNTLINIMVFFKSIMGPKTRNARMDGVEKVALKDAPIKASASEQSERIKAKPIMTKIEEDTPSPISTSVLVDT